MRGYFLWFLSDTMNATNIPKDSISVNALTTSIGSTSSPGSLLTRQMENQQCHQPLMRSQFLTNKYSIYTNSESVLLLCFYIKYQNNVILCKQKNFILNLHHDK